MKRLSLVLVATLAGALIALPVLYLGLSRRPRDVDLLVGRLFLDKAAFDGAAERIGAGMDVMSAVDSVVPDNVKTGTYLWLNKSTVRLLQSDRVGARVLVMTGEHRGKIGWILRHDIAMTARPAH